MHFCSRRCRVVAASKRSRWALLLLTLHVAVDDLFVTLGVERYRQPGASNCRDGAIAKLWVSDPISDCECTDVSGRGLCNRLRKGSFAAGFLSSSARLFGAHGARHGQSPICFGSEKSKAYHARVLRRMQSQRMLTRAEPTRMVGPKVSSRRKCVAEALDQNQCARAERGKRSTSFCRRFIG
jgi:hypothetical protein